MVEPVTALKAAATAVSSVGKIVSARQQAAMSQYQAAMAHQKAEYQRQLAASHEAKARKEDEKFLAQQRARLSAAGVDISQGSALLAQENAAAQAEFDARMIRSTGFAKARSLEQRAQLYGMSARATTSSSAFKVGTTLLKSARGLF